MSKLAKEIEKYFTDRGVRVTVKEVTKLPQGYMRIAPGGKGHLPRS